ncbi:MAG: hypothetical protein H7232_14950 [Aeromicrobium sp.]|nr:hypothetical protein [Burkholderiales bacterium]
MSIDQQCSQGSQINEMPGTRTEADEQVALEQSASYETRLAIARWSNPSSKAMLPIPAPARKMVQAQWYEKTQRDFQEWLGRGGFAQNDVICAEMK